MHLANPVPFRLAEVREVLISELSIAVEGA